MSTSHSLTKKKLFHFNADFKHDFITIATFFNGYIAALLFIFSTIMLCLPKLDLLDLNHSTKMMLIGSIIVSFVLFYLSFLGYKHNKKKDLIIENLKSTL
jgi:hypothetical protein